MRATVKSVKAAPAVAAKKRRTTPVAVQARRSAQAAPVVKTKKAAKVKKVSADKVAAPAEQLLQPETVTEPVTVKPAATPKASSEDGVDRILLPSRMEMASLDEAYQLLQSRYPPVHSKYILDGAQMNVIDMAGIQMLIGFIRSVTAKGCKVEWDNYSVQVYQLASELGVTSQLGD